MSKRLIKIYISLIVLAMLICTQIFSTSAVVGSVLKGDVDDNGRIEIDDVTLLQKYLAGLEELNEKGIFAADVKCDNMLNVDDVTMIQKYLAGLIKDFNISTNDEVIPAYYYEDNYLDNKISEINDAVNMENGVSFIFITDVHFNDNQNNSKYLISKILDETDIPFVIYGGDTVSVYGTENDLQQQIAEFVDFKNCIGKDNLFCTRGNHDFYNVTSSADRTMHSLTTAEVYDLLFRDSEDTVSSLSAKNGCYCIDDEQQKTRIVMLNTSDLSSKPDHIGGGVLFRGSTLEWLSEVLTEKEDYKIIIVCHHPVNYENEKMGNDFSGENADGLFKLISAFKNKTTFSTTRFGVEVNADFTETTNELVCVVSGHRHMDLDSVQENVLNIVTTGDTLYANDGYRRRAGTITEQAFDIYCINYDTQRINLIRIGAGENREFSY